MQPTNPNNEEEKHEDATTDNQNIQDNDENVSDQWKDVCHELGTKIKMIEEDGEWAKQIDNANEEMKQCLVFFQEISKPISEMITNTELIKNITKEVLKFGEQLPQIGFAFNTILTIYAIAELPRKVREAKNDSWNLIKDLFNHVKELIIWVNKNKLSNGEINSLTEGYIKIIIECSKDMESICGNKEKHNCVVNVFCYIWNNVFCAYKTIGQINAIKTKITDYEKRSEKLKRDKTFILTRANYDEVRKLRREVREAIRDGDTSTKKEPWEVLLSRYGGNSLPKREFLEGTRSWVFQEFDDWINKSEYNKERIFILAAPAGFGKTAITCQIVDKYHSDKTQMSQHQDGTDNPKDNVIAWYFFNDEYSLEKYPKNMLLSLAYQLAKQLPEYATRLNNFIDEKKLTEDKLENKYNINAVFKHLLKKRLDNMKGNKTYVIVIDALDECCETAKDGMNDILDCIRDHFLKLPKWIKIFITSQPQVRIQNQLEGFKNRVIQPAQNNANQKDLDTYFDKKLNELTESNNLVLKDNRDKIIKKLLMKSEGLFLQAEDFMNQLKEQKDPVTEETIYSLSSGNQAYEKRFRERILNNDNFTNSLEWKIVRMVTVVAEPMSLDIIKELTGCDINSLYAAKVKLTHYFILTNNKIYFHHKSLRDWFTNPKKEHQFMVDVEKAHQFVGTKCINYLKSKEVVDGTDDNTEFTELSYDIDYKSPSPTIQYVLRYGISHLYNAQMKKHARKLLLSVGWITTRLLVCKFDYNILHDYEQLEKNDTMVHLIGRAIRLASTTLRRNPLHLPTQLVGRLYGSLEYYSKGNTNSSKKLFKELSSFIKKLKEFSYGYEWWCPVSATFEQTHDPLLLSFEEHKNSIISFLTFSPDDSKIASGDEDGNFFIWNANSGEIIKQDKKPGIIRAGIWIDNDNLTLASNDFVETSIRIWTTNVPDDIILEGHTNTIRSIEFSHDKKMVASGGNDNSIRIWDLNSNGQCRHVFPVNHCYGISLSWSPKDKWLVASLETYIVSFWNIASGKSTSWDADDDTIAVDWCPNIQTSRVAFVYDKKIKVLDCIDSDSGEVQCNVQRTLELDEEIRCTKWHPNGTRMAIGMENTIRIWDSESKKCDGSFQNHHLRNTKKIEWSHDGMKLASGSGHWLGLWSLSTVVDDPSESVDQTKKLQWLNNVSFTETVSRSDKFKGCINGNKDKYCDFVWLKHDSDDFFVSTVSDYNERKMYQSFWNPVNGKCVMIHELKNDELNLESMDFSNNIPHALYDEKYYKGSNQNNISAINPMEDVQKCIFKVNGNNIGYSYFDETEYFTPNVDPDFFGNTVDLKSFKFFELKKI